MTKLYYSYVTVTDPSFVQAFSSGIEDLECVQVDLNEFTTIHGDDFYGINPGGVLPCLILSDGSIIDVKSEILECIADNHSSVRSSPFESPTKARHNKIKNKVSSVFSNLKSFIHISPRDRSRSHSSTESVSSPDSSVTSSGRRKKRFSFYFQSHTNNNTFNIQEEC